MPPGSSTRSISLYGAQRSGIKETTPVQMMSEKLLSANEMPCASSY